MVTSPSDRTEARTQSTSTFAMTSRTGKPAQLDTEQVFRLIDSILPFEACLYHQVLPLGLEGSRLRLGMVSLEDTAALDYVRRILAYMNCSLAPQTITTELHHGVLTAYLNHAGRQHSTIDPATTEAPAIAPTDTEADVPTHPPNVPESPEPRDSGNLNQDSNPTFLVDSPEELQSAIADTAIQPPPTSPPVPPALVALEVPPRPAESPPEARAIGALPVLHVDARHLSDAIEVLAALPPDRLLQELLGRILMGGIGRLYFERQQSHGRILWSQNGVLQSVLNDLPQATIQGVINELKRLNRLPQIPVRSAKQVEIERLYQKHRLLLRFRVMPGAYGEEATLQVLRGAALKFYQQQQLTTISRDALAMAQELQQKVQELRFRSRSQTAFTPEQLSILPALDEIIKSVEQQLEALRIMRPDSTSEP